MNKVTITTDRTNGQVRFELAEELRAVVALVVADRTGEITWRITPSTMGKNTAVSRGFIVGPLSNTVVDEIMQSAPPNRGAPHVTVDAVTYGVAPDGYKELKPARSLAQGETYSVIVMSTTDDVAVSFTA